MDDHLGEARVEVRDRLEVELFPLIARNFRTGNHHRIEQDVVLRKRRLRLYAWIAPRSEKWQVIFARNLDIRSHQLGRGEQRAHVAVEMRRTNSERQRADDLGANLTLDLERLRLRR